MWRQVAGSGCVEMLWIKYGTRGSVSCLSPLTMSSKIFFSLGFLESMEWVWMGEKDTRPLSKVWQSVAAHVGFVHIRKAPKSQLALPISKLAHSPRLNIKWTATNPRKGMWLAENHMNTILSGLLREVHRRVLPVVTRWWVCAIGFVSVRSVRSGLSDEIGTRRLW